MHFMSPLPHMAHKGHTPYLFQAAKTHFQFPRSLLPACSVQQDNGGPRKMADGNRKSKPRDENFAGSERTARLHIPVTTQLLSSLCSCSFTLFATETRCIEQQQLTLITLDVFGLDLVPIKTKQQTS